ncbi:cytosine/adenosine deaminase-related metal-dependent hydrolase [Pelomonas saccharophila]|uniref:Cytosine/adenosine deaminase-related metal-dependent hydrolase n=1 Tax=Roseateles saccharophilus TaxID=304 RepID=A0ABU1YTY5_ROSSA|nr:amidohydrolase family protein [Roseateles saccharophilus]MDR7272334.1 cytosine/adenosine deaminase-related metal-dependent hydrolase [Roseateles saccharophilus]
MLLTCSFSQAQTPTPPQQPYQASAPLSWELKNARWFDGRQIQRGNLYVEHGVFVAKKPAQVNRKMDMRGQVLISPLAEAHNHNLQTAWGWGQFADKYIDEGVFYAAMLCGDPAGVAEVKPLAATPAAPDVSFVTACITSPDGYPLAAVLPEPSAEAAAAQNQIVLVDSPEQAIAHWPAIKARGGAWLRIVLAHSERPELRQQPAMFGRLGLRPDTAKELTRLAHAEGRRVVAHVETAADFEAALRAGVDAIAHLPGYANTLDEAPEVFAISEATAAQAARQHTAVITTTAATALFKLDAAALAAMREVQRANLARLQAAGVQLLIGSDVFIATARAELHALEELGLDRATLLRLATRDTPRVLFPGRKLGCFEPGCEASFLVLGSDPLADLAQVDMPMLRVKQGRLLTRLADVAASSSQASASTAEPPKKAAAKKKAGSNTKAKTQSKAKRR